MISSVIIGKLKIGYKYIIFWITGQFDAPESCIRTVGQLVENGTFP